MDKQSKEQWASISHEHAQDCLSRIASSDPEASYELAQIFMSRVPQKDVGIILIVIEALIRQSAMLGSAEAQKFLADGWAEMKANLERRLERTFSSSP